VVTVRQRSGDARGLSDGRCDDLDVAKTLPKREVLAAYRQLLDGAIDPIVELLAADVEWTETVGVNKTRTLVGRAEVTGRLRARRSGSKPIRLRALRLDDTSIAAELDQPWWDKRPRWHRYIWNAIGAKYTQTLTYTSEVERIESKEWFPRLDRGASNDRDFLAMVLTR